MSDIKGFKELSAKMNKIEQQLASKILKAGARKFATEVKKQAKRNAPVKSGNLKKTMRHQVRQNKKHGMVIAKVGPDKSAWYGNIIQHGARKHKIKAKKAKTLAFGGARAKSVNHPGIKKNQFLSKAFEQKRRPALKEAGKVIFKLLSQV